MFEFFQNLINIIMLPITGIQFIFTSVVQLLSTVSVVADSMTTVLSVFPSQISLWLVPLVLLVPAAIVFSILRDIF